MLAARMTHQAMRRIFLGVGAEMKNGILLERSRYLLIHTERKDGVVFKSFARLRLIAFRILHGLRVGFSRPVTNFASGNVALAGNSYFGVRSFFIFRIFGLVAGTALVDARVAGRICRKEGLRHGGAGRGLRHLLAQHHTRGCQAANEKQISYP